MLHSTTCKSTYSAGKSVVLKNANYPMFLSNILQFKIKRIPKIVILNLIQVKKNGQKDVR